MRKMSVSARGRERSAVFAVLIKSIKTLVNEKRQRNRDDFMGNSVYGLQKNIFSVFVYEFEFSHKVKSSAKRIPLLLHYSLLLIT